jgi:phosphoglucosamine mutase
MLQQQVLEQQADLGIALDGDGDRLMMVDHKGEITDGDEELFIIARQKQRVGQLTGAVVGTQMSNLGLEHALRTLGLDFRRAKVGDRYIMEMLREGGWTLGGETSGHIICLDMTSTGDGIVSALQVLEAVVSTGNSLYDLKQGMQKYPQKLVNVRMQRRMDVVGLDAVQRAVREAEVDLGRDGRVLLRPSGTEPVLRVMVEGREESTVDRIAEQLANVVEQAIAQAAA